MQIIVGVLELLAVVTYLSFLVYGIHVLRKWNAAAERMNRVSAALEKELEECLYD